MTHGPRPPAGIRTIGEIPESATRLVLVRHGQALANVEGFFGGPTGCSGLSALGHSQAQALGAKWQREGLYQDADLLVSSTLLRAEQTAEHLAQVLGGVTRLAPREDLCELHPGAADTLTWQQYEQRFGGVNWDEDATTPIAPGGESWAAFTSRVVGALTRLAEEFPAKTVIVATHAGVIESSMLHFVYGGPETRRLGLRTDHCSVTEWAAFDGTWFLVRYNA